MKESTKALLYFVVAILLTLLLLLVYLNAGQIESLLSKTVKPVQQNAATVLTTSPAQLNLTNQSYRFPPMKVSYDVYTGQKGYSGLPSYFAVTTGRVVVSAIGTGEGSLLINVVNGSGYPLIAFSGGKVYVGDYGDWGFSRLGKGAVIIKGDYGALAYPVNGSVLNVTLVEGFDATTSSFYLRAYVNGTFLGELVSNYPPGLFRLSEQFVSGNSNLFGSKLGGFKGLISEIVVRDGLEKAVIYVQSGLIQAQGVWASLNGTSYSLVAVNA
ncbi:MAG: hypothetical protein ACP5HQ_03015 [Thermoprotei archaeon]